jgi:hypothetical protein
MNLRRKIVGVAAMAAFAVSFSGSAFAATGDTKAALDSNPTGECSAVVSAGEIDLGTWTWNGTAYDHVAATTPGSLTVSVSQDIQPSIVCDVDLTINNLTSGGNTILGTDLDVSATSGGTGSGSAYSVTTPSGGQNLVLAVVAQSDAVTAQAPGDYLGTITVSSATAAE